MSRARMGIALTALLALALSGCVAQGEADSTPSPDAGTPSASPLPPISSPPVPGEVEEDAADPATWLVETDRIGPIELGESFSVSLGELPEDWINDEHCSWVAYWSAPDGSYLVSFQRAAEGEDDAVTGVSVEWLSDVSGIGPRTAEGLGVGATADEVRAVHPDAEEVDSPVDGISFLRIGDARGAMFFEYGDAGDGASSVSVTSQETPSYEACA